MNKKFITLFSIALIISINVLPAAMTADDLFTAVAQGKVERAQEIIRQKGGHVFIHALDAHGRTPLHIAALNGHPACIDLLITNGARVDDPGTQEYTPLHCAAANGHAKCVLILMHYRADINAVAKHKTPLMIAAINGHEKCVQLLLAANADPTYTPIISSNHFYSTAFHTPEKQARYKGFTKIERRLREARERQEAEEKALQNSAPSNWLNWLFS